MVGALRKRCFAGTAQRGLSFAWAIGCAIAVAMPAWADPKAETLFLLDVCDKGPASDIARAKRRTGDALQSASRVLPNPTLSVEHQHSITPTEETETIVGISVPLGIGGRRFLLKDAADGWREAGRLDADGGLVDSALDARVALIHLVAIEARLAAARRAQTDLESVTGDIAELAKAGDVSRFESLRQGSAVRVHAADVTGAEARLAGAKARLKGWAPAPVDTSDLRLDELARGSAPADAVHPKLAALDAGVSASRIEASAARRKAVPEIELFGGYRAVTTPGFGVGHGFVLALKIPLTFLDHGQAEEALADATGARLLAERDAFVTRQKTELQASMDEDTALSARSADLSAAVADSRDLVRQARILYRAGESSIADLLSALSAAESADLAEIDLEEQLALSRVEAMRARGSLFDPALDRACGARVP